MTDLDLDELDRLYAEATDGSLAMDEIDGDIYAEQDGNFEFIAEFAERKNAAFTVALHNAYPALSARLRELEDHVATVYTDEYASFVSASREIDSLRAELESVKRERDEWKECAAARLNVSEAIDRA